MTDPLDSQLPALDELRGEFLRVARGDSGSVTRRRMPLTAAVLAGVALLVAGGLVGVIVTSSGEGTGQPAAKASVPSQGDGGSAGVNAPAPTGFAAYEPTFGSVSELASKSDLVVVGTVQDAALGDVVIPDPDYPTRALDVTLNVEDTLKGPASPDSITVATLETAYTGPPDSVTDWRTPGQRIVAFLKPDRGNGSSVYQPVSYVQSFYTVRDDELSAVDREATGSLSERIGAMSLSELRQDVEATPAGK